VSNIHRGEFTRISIRLSDGRVQKIKCLEFDKQGNLWIGTWSLGLIKYNPTTGHYKHYPSARGDDGPLVNQVMTLKADDDNSLWVGTFNGGLSRLDLAKDKFTHYPSLSAEMGSPERYNVKTIHIDRNGNLWVSAETRGLTVKKSSHDFFQVIKNDILTEVKNRRL
jgi:ligand-binding sensor domain-containing protein